MHIDEWQREAVRVLLDSGIATARLDSLVLLEDAMNTDRTQLLAHPETTLTPGHIKQLSDQIELRSQHVPLAYIRGKTEFYGREFMVSSSVLEPRPESETMITLLKQLSLSHRVLLADIGCGSGALGISAALELGLNKVYLHDIDHKALAVARQNVTKHHVCADLLHTNLLKNYNAAYEVLLCNLPYVPDDFSINTAATHEPRVAIFGGPDGLDLYRQLFVQLSALPNKPRYIFTECLPVQHTELVRIAAQRNYRLSLTEDFIQLFVPS